jgi:predicted transposase YbfD/YdcC
VQSVEPLDLNFPHVCTVIHVRRRFRSKKNRGDWDNSYYLSSETADSKTPKQWLQTIRDHWGGIEIRNHWRKDACLMEDKTRSRNPQIVGNLILLRNLVLHFFIEHRETYGSLPAFVEAVSADSELALALIQGVK